jgi:uncharacterized protein (PEP-CTERM system associated)
MMRSLGLGILLLLVASPVLASRWAYDKGLSITSTTTGNVGLTAQDQQSDTVLRVRPYLGIRRISGRTNARLFYAPDFRYYLQGTEDSKIGHSLRADASTELVKRIFVLRVSARASQVLINPADRVGFDDVNNPDAFTQGFAFNITPDIRLPAYSEKYASIRLRPGLNYGFTADSSGGKDGLSQTGSTTSLDIVSGPYFSRMPWRIRYRNDIFDADAEDSWGRLEGFVRYRISANYSLDLILGYDSLKTGGQDNQGGVRWQMSATWTPNPRTSLTLGFGEAFFGDDWTLSFRHRHRHTVFSASYHVDVQDVTTEFLTRDVVAFEDAFGQEIIDPLEGDPLLVEVGTPTLVDDIYIRRAFTATVTQSRGRTSVQARLRYNERDYQRSPLDTQDAVLDLTANRTLSKKLRGNVRLNYWDHQEDNLNAQDFEQYGAEVGVSYSLSRKIRVSVTYRYLERSSSISEQNFDDGQVNFGLRVNYL